MLIVIKTGVGVFVDVTCYAGAYFLTEAVCGRFAGASGRTIRVPSTKARFRHVPLGAALFLPRSRSAVKQTPRQGVKSGVFRGPIFCDCECTFRFE